MYFDNDHSNRVASRTTSSSAGSSAVFNVTRGSTDAPSDELKTEILRLKRELERITKERELLKKSMVSSTGQCSNASFRAPNVVGADTFAD